MDYSWRGYHKMDGQKHRVSTNDDKKGEKSAVYVGYLTDQATGWFRDFRHDSDITVWKSNDQVYDQKAKMHLKAISLQRQQKKLVEQTEQYAHCARRATQIYAAMSSAPRSHPYLQTKGVRAYSGVKMDKEGRLVIPLRNENGEIRSLQRIDEQGNKRLMKNAQKSGNYFVVGGELVDGEPVLYAEGYATAASIAEATDRPVVMTVDAGNLPHVAARLTKRYSKSPHVILGDDDREKQINTGQKMANEAANLTQGTTVFPVFSSSEKQLGLTDFNDLHQTEGINAVKEQIETVLSSLTYPQEKTDSVDVNQEQEPTTTSDPTSSSDAPQSPSHDKKKNTTEPLFTDTDNSIEPDEEQEPTNTSDPSTSHASQSPRNDEKTETNIPKDSENFYGKASRTIKKRIKKFQTFFTGKKKKEKQASKDSNENTTDKDTGENTANKTSQSPKHDRENEKTHLPADVAKSFVEADGKYYFKKNPDTLAFVDKGKKLYTKLSHSPVVSAMVDVAEAKGWSLIHAKGKENFRYEAWLEGMARGLSVKGYKPSKDDLARLKTRMEECPVNTMETETQKEQRRTQQEQETQEKQKTRKKQKTQQEQKTQVNEGITKEYTQPRKGKFVGKLTNYGSAPYKNDPNNKLNYYATVENEDGKESIIWGVDLERAIRDANAKNGDRIILENEGRKPIQVKTYITDKAGRVIKEEFIDTYRNTWNLTVSRENINKSPSQTDINKKTLNELAKKFVKENPEILDPKVLKMFLNSVNKESELKEKTGEMPNITIKTTLSTEKGPLVDVEQEP